MKAKRVKQRLKLPRFFILASLIVTLMLGGCLAAESPTPAPTTTPDSFSDVVEKVMPSVVYIFVETNISQFGRNLAGSGSGVILHPDGYILTNRHVVEDAKRAEVTLQNRQVYEVNGIWIDDILDLAVVKIDAENLPAAQFGEPDSVRVGDWAIAMGHPLGLSPEEGGATVTVGVVSNLGRAFFIGNMPYYDVIQTDAAINPGNSGGPLVNLQGEVIGINSAGAGEAQNINFAISTDTARRVFEDLVQYGRVIRPYFGAYSTDITPDIACELCLTERIGAVLVEVDPEGPASLAGLQQNDIIVSFGGEKIEYANRLIKELWKHNIGDSVKVVFWRGETEMEATVTLGERSSQS